MDGEYVLGVDPGFAHFGWALLRVQATRVEVVGLGVVVTQKSHARGSSVAQDNVRRGGEIAAALEDLMTRPEGPFVARLAREPGRRESRYAQLFTGPPTQALAGTVTEPAAAPLATAEEPGLVARVAALEAEVAELRREFMELKQTGAR